MRRDTQYQPPGQGARLADDDCRAAFGDQLAEVLAFGSRGLDAGAVPVTGVSTGDSLVFAQVQVENEAGGRLGEFIIVTATSGGG
jgi:hypothetical protein